MTAAWFRDVNGPLECPCGNTRCGEGFVPCDQDGRFVEPTPNEWDRPLFRCDRCGTIIDANTGEIAGHAA